ncbi:MAG TPA: Tat pathway signal protein, partial [Burkholderiaceae bacterium]|nr:Tat pathway signal protein [Burkholderiaceae bacterium]
MSQQPSNASRRAFLRRLGALSASGVAAPLAANLAAIGSAAAQAAGGYKALVCIFMYGGNDAYNTVLA